MSDTNVNYLNVPQSVSAGVPLNVEGAQDMWYQAVGTFTATVNIEGSLNGTDWVQLVAGAATGSIVQIPEKVRYLRANVSAYTSGAPQVLVLTYTP